MEETIATIANDPAEAAWFTTENPGLGHWLLFRGFDARSTAVPGNRRVQIHFQDTPAVRAAVAEYLTDPLVPARTYAAYVPILRRLLMSARYRADAARLVGLTVVSVDGKETTPQQQHDSDPNA